MIRIQDPADQLESLTRFETEKLEEEELLTIAEVIRRNLRLSQQVVSDFRAMSRLITRSASQLARRDEVRLPRPV